MSTDKNKALVRRWVEEVWNHQKVDEIDELAASDYVRRDPNLPEVRGREAEKDLVRMYLTAFPDLEFAIDDMVAEGDRVVARLTARGTHRGELLGIPPTGKPVAVETVEIYRLDAGAIAEEWVATDVLGMMQQLGAIPVP